jgi:hypothetical protein
MGCKENFLEISSSSFFINVKIISMIGFIPRTWVCKEICDEFPMYSFSINTICMAFAFFDFSFYQVITYIISI